MVDISGDQKKFATWMILDVHPSQGSWACWLHQQKKSRETFEELGINQWNMMKHLLVRFT